jgi:DNA invertase Pin-like site-specific DNA recombinase
MIETIPPAAGGAFGTRSCLRRELKNMLGKLAPGDVVMLKRIDRPARSAFDLFGIIKRLADAKATIPIRGGAIGR